MHVAHVNRVPWVALMLKERMWHADSSEQGDTALPNSKLRAYRGVGTGAVFQDEDVQVNYV